jgi:hypothetical protein
MYALIEISNQMLDAGSVVGALGQRTLRGSLDMQLRGKFR